MKIEQATPVDAREILALQKLAYQSEAEIYNDFTIPPLHQTLSETLGDFEKGLVLKASVEGRIIGSVRAHVEDRTCYIGKLIVHPEFQNRGIGTRLMQAIERRLAYAQRYELFTGDRSTKNLHLYRKLGYTALRSEKITDQVTLVFLEKRSHHPSQSEQE